MQMRSSKTGRSRWPWVVAGVLALALVGGVAYGQINRGGSTEAAPTLTPTRAPSTPGDTSGDTGAGDDEAGTPPTGCLGGTQRTAAMVLAAQKKGAHSSYGATEVATAYYRWLWQYPAPSAADIDSVSKNVTASDATSAWKDLAAQYKAAGDDPTQGVVPAGEPFYVSTTNGLWAVSPDSTSDRVTVNLATGYVISGALSPTKVAGIALVMVWEDGAWHVQSGKAIDKTLLSNGGVRYTGGC